MENTFFKNLLEQFPYISLVLVISVGLLYLIKLILNIQKDYSQTNLNDEVRQSLILEKENKELVNSLEKLKVLLYSSDELLNSILLESNYIEVNKLSIFIETYINKLPENWQFMKCITLEKESVQKLKEIKSQIIIVKKNSIIFVDANTYRIKTKKILLEIENLFNIILEYNKKINTQISFFEKHKELGLLSLFLIFGMSSSLLIIDYQKELVTFNSLEQKYLATIDSYNRLEKELNTVSLAKAKAEKSEQKYIATIGELRKELEIISTSNNEDKNNSLEKEEINIKINWNSKDDLDLSVVLANDNSINYLHDNKFDSELQASFITDEKSGPATEEIKIKKPSSGIYTICVSNYPNKNLVKFKIYQSLGEKIIWEKLVNTIRKRKCFKFLVKNNNVEIPISD